MDNYIKLSNILFDNKESLSDNEYLNLMNLLKSDYDNNTLTFTSYIIHNDTTLDDQVTLDLLVIILKNLKELVFKEQRNSDLITYTKIMPVVLFFLHIYHLLN